MMKPWAVEDLYLGEGFESSEHCALFGSAGLVKGQLRDRFSKFKFSFLRQVHGSTVVEAAFNQTLEADGQITRERNLALVIQTADCVPVLMGNRQEIGALHAGWRGVAANIVAKAADKLRSTPDWVALGPHIQFDSFEIGHDVADQLTEAAPPGSAAAEWLKPHPDPNKCFFNLVGLLSAQIRAQFPKAVIWSSPVSTISDPRYHSFRRDKPDPGRQYSFVVLKD